MLKRQTFVSVPFGFAQGTHSLRVHICSGYARLRWLSEAEANVATVEKNRLA